MSIAVPFDSSRLTDDITGSGIIGSINFLVIRTPAMEGIPKIKAALILIFPFLIFCVKLILGISLVLCWLVLFALFCSIAAGPFV